MEDIELFGTAVAVLAQANPVVAIAIGAITGIFGKVFFDSATKPKDKKKNAETAKLLVTAKEIKHVEESE